MPSQKSKKRPGAPDSDGEPSSKSVKKGRKDESQSSKNKGPYTYTKPRPASRPPLTKWNDLDDMRLLFGLLHWLRENDMPVDWDAVGKCVTAYTTGEAVIQHLVKLRKKWEDAGYEMPPKGMPRYWKPEMDDTDAKLPAAGRKQKGKGKKSTKAKPKAGDKLEPSRNFSNPAKANTRRAASPEPKEEEDSVAEYVLDDDSDASYGKPSKPKTRGSRRKSHNWGKMGQQPLSDDDLEAQLEPSVEEENIEAPTLETPDQDPGPTAEYEDGTFEQALQQSYGAQIEPSDDAHAVETSPIGASLDLNEDPSASGSREETVHQIPRTPNMSMLNYPAPGIGGHQSQASFPNAQSNNGPTFSPSTHNGHHGIFYNPGYPGNGYSGPNFFQMGNGGINSPVGNPFTGMHQDGGSFNTYSHELGGLFRADGPTPSHEHDLQRFGSAMQNPQQGHGHAMMNTHPTHHGSYASPVSHGAHRNMPSTPYSRTPRTPIPYGSELTTSASVPRSSQKQASAFLLESDNDDEEVKTEGLDHTLF